jgi:hypothetical protein
MNPTTPDERYFIVKGRKRSGHIFPNCGIKDDGGRVFLADVITRNVWISMGERSFNPKLFKTQIVQKRLQPDATISGAAISHSVSAEVILK